LKHFDRQTWPKAEPASPGAAADGPPVDLQARLRAMWRWGRRLRLTWSGREFRMAPNELQDRWLASSNQLRSTRSPLRFGQICGGDMLEQQADEQNVSVNRVEREGSKACRFLN
jgi:hypothetical protein